MNTDTMFIKVNNEINFCGKVIGYEIEYNEFSLPYEIQPTKGEHDFNNCEGCKKTLKELTQRLTQRFEGTYKEGAKPFPFCCPIHSKLVKQKYFNRQDFVNVPEMVARKIIYTINHIKNNHYKEGYYKEITEYVQYTIDSFGKMPETEPLYLSDYFLYVIDILQQIKDINQRRKNELLKYFEAFINPSVKGSNTDFNILIDMYQKWLNIFPFEISFFADLKPKFEKQLPIFKGTERNKYSGKQTFIIHTKSSLVNYLLNLTNDIITQINTTSLHEKGLLSEPQKIKLELIINERKNKLKQGYVNNSKDEGQQFRKIIKEWYADEKKFIDEITPHLKGLKPKQLKSNLTDKTRLIDYRFQTIFPDSVNELYKLLNDQILIKTNEEHFVWAFGIGEDKPTDFKPIVWCGENTLLAYLIDKICQNRNKWKVAEMIFGVKGLRQSLTNCKSNPRGKELIDDIITEIG